MKSSRGSSKRGQGVRCWGVVRAHGQLSQMYFSIYTTGSSKSMLTSWQPSWLVGVGWSQDGYVELWGQCDQYHQCGHGDWGGQRGITFKIVDISVQQKQIKPFCYCMEERPAKYLPWDLSDHSWKMGNRTLIEAGLEGDWLDHESFKANYRPQRWPTTEISDKTLVNLGKQRGRRW